MDYSSESSVGQQKVIITAASVEKVAHLSALMQMLRAWYEYFERSLRELDNVAALKVHDLITEGVIAARQLARELSFTLPELEPQNWVPSPRPPSASVDF